MFDTVFAGLGQAALIAAIGQCARQEAQAGARKLAAIAQLTHLSVSYDSERDQWAYDSWAATASEVGAVLNMGHKRASGQMWIATALRDRLPTVGALYLQGRLSARVVSQISWRTRLVQDWQALALLDTAIADQAAKWESLSETALERAIDAAVNRYDPDAVLRAKEAITTRDVRIGSHEDPDGLTTVYGQLLGCDAATLAARITAMVKGICDNDPRTMGERRSCAMGAIIAGHDHLPCRCGSPECTATPPPTSNVTIAVIADPAAITAARNLIAAEDNEQQKNHAKPDPEPETETEPEPEPETEPEPEPEAEAEAEPEDERASEAEPEAPNPQRCPQDSGVALSPGAKILPIAALAEAIRAGAAIKALWLPGPHPEPHYRPSAKLAAFIRARDLFCRFPGCTVPAERCDIDHVTPWPYGPTHPSNLHCKCRTHHLGKTFDDRWREEQHPDGTVTWTTPTGRRYTTAPGSQLFFPTWNPTTAELPPPAQPPPPDPDRITKMPKRRRTRAADNAARITAERAHNAATRATHQTATQTAARQDHPPPEPPPDHGDDPPPF